MRLPKKSEGDSPFTATTPVIFTSHIPIPLNHTRLWLGPQDLALAQKLILAGDEHAKCMRGIVAWIKVTAPWYWWNEMDTYTVGRTPLSSTSSMHIECKGLKGEELQEAKANIRGDFPYTRIWTANYQCLRHIYFQRRFHRLPEWKQFCDFIKILPLAEELIMIERKKHDDN